MDRNTETLTRLIRVGLIIVAAIILFVLGRRFLFGPSVKNDDFNYDGKPDLVWQNQATGQIGVWFMNETSLIRISYFTPARAADANWKIAGTGDFNDDGKPDLVWQNQATGQILVWFLNGTTRSSVSSFNPAQPPDANWRMVGTGDFNDDGKPDLVWQNQATGQIGVWFLNGTAQTGYRFFSPGQAPDPNWKIVGTADFNKDGKPDLLWQHQNSGQIGVWFLDGTNRTSWSFFNPGQPPDANWRMVSTGDFNGDSKPDLVWHNLATGQIGVWFLNGTIRTGWSFFKPAQVTDMNWKMANVWTLMK
jgi:hypothetical protein